MISYFIYGGSFDPVHLGHINAAKHISILFFSTKIYILTFWSPALKEKNFASAKQRLDMLHLTLNELLNLKSTEQK